MLGVDGKFKAIKYITDDLSDHEALVDVLQECIIQAVIAETTKGKPNGPYAPLLYDVGWDMDEDKLYICSELLDNKLENLIEGSTPAVNDAIIPNALIQLADALDFLHKSYEFSHRDLKSDNVMYSTRADGSYQFRFIDFGLSCMTWNGVRLSGASWWDDAHTCYKVDRDLTQLIYEIVGFKASAVSAGLLGRLQKLLKLTTAAGDCRLDLDCDSAAAGPMNWLKSYNMLNRANVRARGTPSRVKTEMQAFQRGSPFKDTPVAAIVAASPPAPCPLGTVMGPDGACVADPAPPGVSGTTPSPPPAAAAKPCPKGQIRNPATGRCVKKTGRIGRKIATGSARRSTRRLRRSTRRLRRSSN